MAPKGAPPIIYRVDGTDRISYTSQSWQDFAAAADAERAIDVVGNPLLDYVSDEGTREVYERLMHAVRTEDRPVRFPFRCDSPEEKRIHALTLTPLPDQMLEFRSETILVEPTPQRALIVPSLAYDLQYIPVCSFCLSVRVDDEWMDYLAAFETGMLTGDRSRYAPNYRVCPRCRSKMSARRIMDRTDARALRGLGDR